MPATTFAAAAEGLLRHKIEKAIQQLIDLLDATEPDPDLEPALGWCNPTNYYGFTRGGSDDREEETDCEPWLGWTTTMAHGNFADLEEDFDSGIADPSGAHEQGFTMTPLPRGGTFA